MPRLPPVTTATLLENSIDTIESSVIAGPLETSFDVIKEGRSIRYILGLPSCCFTSPWCLANGRRETTETPIVTNDSNHIVTESAARIFADLADPLTINRLDDGAWKVPFWLALADAGLPLAWVPEQFGGAGASLADGFAVLAVAGRFAVAVPLAETLLAGWLLARAGVTAPNGPLTIAPSRPSDRIIFNEDGTLSGSAIGIPFASEAQHIAVLAEGEDGVVVALVAASDCTIDEGQNLAGDPSNIVRFQRVKPLRYGRAPVGLDQTALMLMGSVSRSVQTAGALETVLSLSVSYANERVAFERPIGKFQAVQHNLARLAGETAAALAVSGSAANTIIWSDSLEEAAFLEGASSKIRCAEAAREGSAIAHQVFGAIGFTKEHVLHRFTLRTLAWRDDFGSESYWAAELGRHVAKCGAEEFWPMVASR
jgi:alkylation response protein AidB-like acyl-CoA dehydrogenase